MRKNILIAALFCISSLLGFNIQNTWRETSTPPAAPVILTTADFLITKILEFSPTHLDKKYFVGRKKGVKQPGTVWDNELINELVPLDMPKNYTQTKVVGPYTVTVTNKLPYGVQGQILFIVSSKDKPRVTASYVESVDFWTLVYMG